MLPLPEGTRGLLPCGTLFGNVCNRKHVASPQQDAADRMTMPGSQAIRLLSSVITREQLLDAAMHEVERVELERCMAHAATFVQHVSPHETVDLYVLADGHGVHGHVVAPYAIQRLLQLFREDVLPLGDVVATVQAELETHSVELISHWLHGEMDMVEQCYERQQMGAITNCIGTESGSTLTMVWVSGEHILVTYLGDSQVLLVGSDRFHFTPNHRTTMPHILNYAERKGALLIPQAQGGHRLQTLPYWNGEAYNVANPKGLGDNAVLGVERTLDVRCYSREGVLCVVAATDGLWDHVDPKTACRVLHGSYLEGSYSPEVALWTLLQLAVAKMKVGVVPTWTPRSHHDDVTVFVVHAGPVLPSQPQPPCDIEGGEG